MINAYKVCFNEETFIVEKFLEGNYKKFCSNQFLINSAYDESDKILNNFSLWTYSKTDCKLMIVDHQGVKEVNNNTTIYYLTDPAINSVERCFGNTDMGEQGIMSCLYTYSLTKGDKNNGKYKKRLK